MQKQFEIDLKLKQLSWFGNLFVFSGRKISTVNKQFGQSAKFAPSCSRCWENETCRIFIDKTGFCPQLVALLVCI
jgi:hypothetical protein